MWVQTPAPVWGTDPADASRVGGQRRSLLLFNALEIESPDALPCSGLWRTWHAACDTLSYGALKIHPPNDKPSSHVLDRSISLTLFYSVQQLFPVK